MGEIKGDILIRRSYLVLGQDGVEHILPECRVQAPCPLLVWTCQVGIQIIKQDELSQSQFI